MQRAVRGILWLLVLAGAVLWQWGPALGDSRSEACLSRATPAAVSADMNWRPEAAQSWWPLGVTCTWSNQATGEPPVEDRPGWGPTAAAVVALGAVALEVRRAARTRRPPGPRGRRAGSSGGSGRPPRPPR